MDINILHQITHLREEYNVVGGGRIVEEIKQIEQCHYKEYLSGRQTRSVKRPMLTCVDDNDSDELPLFMVNLGEEHVATCYRVEEIPKGVYDE